jgi:hypothetical protein
MGADRVCAGDWAIGCERVFDLLLVAKRTVKQRYWIERRLVDEPGSDDDRAFVGKVDGDVSVGDNQNDMDERRPGAQKRDCAAWIALEQTSDLYTRSNQRSPPRRTYAFMELATRW